MRLIKYDKTKETITKSASSGGSSTVTEETISRSGEREIWGQNDTFDDIDGSMTVNGDITIKSITPLSEDEDDDGDGEYEDYEEGGGNLNVENKITTNDFETNNATINKHLYVTLPHAEHNGVKKCLVEIAQNNATNIANNTINITTNTNEINSLKTTVNNHTTNITNNTNNITNLTGRVEKLESKKAVGYYWSAQALVNSSNQPTKPVEPLTYLGADIGTFEVTQEKPYLWRTIDGENYSIVSYWLPPDADKYYIASTLVCGYYDTNNKVHNYPAGFVAFNTPNLTTPYGKSGWTDGTYKYASQGAAAPNLNYPTTIFNTVAGSIPRVDGYPHIWEISDISDANDYTKWKHLQSGSDNSNTGIQHVIEYSDWGNRSVAPGYGVFIVGDDNNVPLKYLGEEATDPYITGEGTATNWNNAVWRKSFLIYILSDFLYKNRAYYNDKIGWSFNWGGACNSTGYGGQWTMRFGGINAPDSNDPNNIGYFPTSTIGYLLGHVYSETSNNPMRIDFCFYNIRLGKKLPYSQESFSAAGTHSTTGLKKFWDVDYGKVIYKFQDYGASTTD